MGKFFLPIFKLAKVYETVSVLLIEQKE